MPLPLIHYLYSSGLPHWALVTGASDGIGRALCSELSMRGFNVVLHGRNEAKLVRAREQLEAAQPNRHFRTVTADATVFSKEDIDRIVAKVADIPLTILINNVGGTAPLSSNFKHFQDTTSEEIQALYSLNVQFPLQLTRAVLPQLQKQQKPTLVLTCGSQAYIGQAYVAAYSGCKGALHAWNRGLATEQREAHSKVEILEVVIGGTYTQQLQKDAQFSAGLFMPTAETMARAILARVGHGHRSVTPYFWHFVQTGSLYALLPASVADSVIANILKPSVEAKRSD
ncbi:NAD(P)-binding protein [Amniculicola lignicola CBS 123094]|uniref:NAD(P)-binding protein n=1 Tax=Amniculicola lignicola CBS 123094 TaxID=1392246 RepID=A0A6A5VYQ9_9PLEO|nr:NAD(P)-binding protein [Amniculicola lignicola CBS 123094]